jgi:hypothetical protein
MTFSSNYSNFTIHKKGLLRLRGNPKNVEYDIFDLYDELFKSRHPPKISLHKERIRKTDFLKKVMRDRK